MNTAAELIKRAYYLAQVLDPDEEIQGNYASEGLYELNRVISLWGSLSQYIPAYSILTLTTVPNQYSYTQTNVITQLSESHIIDQNNIQFPLWQIDLQRFNTLNFSLSLTAPCRPNLIFIQNDFANLPDASKVILFPVPDAIYTVTMYAMMRLLQVTYSQELDTVPAYWRAAMEYELAKQLMSVYSTVPASTFADDYTTVMRQLKAANKRDKAVQVRNQFQQQARRFRPWSTYVG